jgi:hypothetical protein
MSALRSTVDAQGSLQKQFDRHKCEPEDSGEAPAQVTADVILRQQPDEEEEDDEDDGKEEDDDDDEAADDGYSE